MTTRKLIANLVKLVLTVVVIYFVGRQVWGNWEQIKDYDWHVDIIYLIPSLAIWLGAFFICSSSWRMIIGGFGHRISPAMAFKIAYLSDLGRYIPGKVWQVFGMLYLAKKEGVPEEQTAASFVMFQLFTIPASILVYVLAAQVQPELLSDKFAVMGRGSSYLLGAMMLAVCALLVFYPRPFLIVANYVLRKVGRPAVVFDLDKRVALTIFAGYFTGWIVIGLAFWLFLRAVLGEVSLSIVAAIGLYNVAYQVGYLTFFAPGGLGPRELVMGVLLTPFVGPIAPAVAILARIWSILVDTSAALIALTIKR